MSAREEALDAATQHVAAACNCDMVTARLQIRTVINALRAAGYAVVPREATEAAILAAIERDLTVEEVKRGGMYRNIYRAMIAATEAGE